MGRAVASARLSSSFRLFCRAYVTGRKAAARGWTLLPESSIRYLEYIDEQVNRGGEGDGRRFQVELCAVII